VFFSGFFFSLVGRLLPFQEKKKKALRNLFTNRFRDSSCKCIFTWISPPDSKSRNDTEENIYMDIYAHTPVYICIYIYIFRQKRVDGGGGNNDLPSAWRARVSGVAVDVRRHTHTHTRTHMSACAFAHARTHAHSPQMKRFDPTGRLWPLL